MSFSGNLGNVKRVSGGFKGQRGLRWVSEDGFKWVQGGYNGFQEGQRGQSG